MSTIDHMHAVGCPMHTDPRGWMCICSGPSQAPRLNSPIDSPYSPIDSPSPHLERVDFLNSQALIPNWRDVVAWVWRAWCQDHHRQWWSALLSDSVAYRRCERCGRRWSEIR